MPLYTKFLKDLLTKKRKYIYSETIMLGGKAFIDLGASINLMPLSMCRRIGNLKIDPTRMTLQIADRSITRPFGVVEDVLVKVRHFTFLVKFVIMDIEEDEEILLILG
ncbi:uncharacterized protein LOC114393578 [Glycine soja]|uniref:uncharacterized protein n=1 Tax=Glycine max TaxID=3847 RepID=UPI000719285F|nr:uncharacterized protein LOC106796633 [Glycine max]XP_028210732.1 uncharacterized protein LOC114393578 [Glycine soja]|eukprot:XP_014625013.1 uncharacterized protein LOC106796633 [Glycine max]